MKSALKTMEAPVNQSRVMETETISKNGKKLKSRKYFLIMACFALLVASASVSAQSELTFKSSTWTTGGVFKNETTMI